MRNIKIFTVNHRNSCRHQMTWDEMGGTCVIQGREDEGVQGVVAERVGKNSA